MRAIVVGYDGSEQGERALARAAELAGPLGAKLVVVSVGRPAPLLGTEPLLDPAEPGFAPVPIGPVATGAPVLPDVAQGPPEEQLLLERARGFLVPRRVEAEYVAESGDPAERLIRVAEERDAELIVVGAPAHGFLDRLLGGAVEEQVARRTRRDVLLVH